jgi:hypothetical protein
MFAGSGTEDSYDRVPPQTQQTRPALSPFNFGTLIAKRLFHLVAEVAAEIERE